MVPQGAGAGPRGAPRTFQHKTGLRAPSVGTPRRGRWGLRVSSPPTPLGRKAATRPGPNPRPASLPGFRHLSQQSHTDINPFGARGGTAPLTPVAKTPFFSAGSEEAPAHVGGCRASPGTGAGSCPSQQRLAGRPKLPTLNQGTLAPLRPLHFSVSSAAGSDRTGDKKTFRKISRVNPGPPPSRPVPGLARGAAPAAPGAVFGHKGLAMRAPVFRRKPKANKGARDPGSRCQALVLPEGCGHPQPFAPQASPQLLAGLKPGRQHRRHQHHPAPPARPCFSWQRPFCSGLHRGTLAPAKF